MNKFWTVLGGIFLAVLLTALVGVVMYNNVPAVKDMVDGWSTPQQEQSAEDENNNENGDENGDDENQESETNLKLFVFENDFAKIIIDA